MGTGLSYHVLDKDIVISSKGTPREEILQQQTQVTGKVTDGAGNPIPGVSVLVKGTTTGNITEPNGQYSILGIPENATLVFSFIGMKSQEVFVGKKSKLSIVMEVETFGVDEVVVTALGIKRLEKALGYAVQKVSGDVLTTVKGIDVATSLTGKVAGLIRSILLTNLG